MSTDNSLVNDMATIAPGSYSEMIRVGGEILVNTATAGLQESPQITALANGGFVVTWYDGSQGVGGATEIRAALRSRRRSSPPQVQR